MKPGFVTLATVLSLIAPSSSASPHSPASPYASPPPRVEVASDGKGFVLVPSGKAFVPWGFNYDRDSRFRLIEEYWDAEWATVEQDFREMKELGANVVRVHLQFARFMDAPDAPNEANLARLERLVRLAEDLGLYLDLTGLGCYRRKDAPGWYDALPEAGRWAAQARFWEAVARACADRPGVFCYDLMNDPVVSGDRRPPGEWVHPFAMEGLHYVQFVNLDPAGRERPEIALQWTRQMVAAIRKYDRRHLVTIGLIPIELGRNKPEEASGFVPAKIGPELDFLSIHVYPRRGELGAAVEMVERFGEAGKPVVIEETFPLHCDAKELGAFIERSRGPAAGWIGFYWGKTPAELKASDKLADHLTLAWLELFRAMDPNR